MADKNYEYHYNYGGGSGNQGGGKKKSDMPWWAIVLCFVFGLWPVGIILLIIRLGQESGALSSKKGRAAYDQFAQDARRGADEARQVANEAVRSARDAFQGVTGAQQGQAAGAKAQQKPPKEKAPKQETGAPSAGSQSFQLQQRMKKLKTGKWFTIIGAFLMVLFGLATATTFAENLAYLSYEPLWMLEDLVTPFIFTGIGAGMFTWGRFKKSQNKRFRRYLSLIGEQKQVSIPALAMAYPAKEDAVCTSLQNMIDAGVFGDTAYLDFGRELLVLDGSGVQAEPVRKKAAPETDLGEEGALLRQIRRTNDEIKNPELSRKIDRIEEITGRILEFQKEHPDKAPELRKFLNYYLPTTLKILSSYAELEKQGIEGENIAATKQRIEGMMDMVVEGFERQLDKLFAGDMMDIAADITVMEQMMQGDGLFEKNGGMGLGGH